MTDKPLTPINQCSLLWMALRPFRLHATVLFLVMLFAASSEAMGLGMIIPLLAILLGDEAGPRLGFGRLSELEKFVRSLFSQETLLPGIGGIVLVVYLLKAILVILRSYLSLRFVNMLRRHWMGGVLERYLFSDHSRVVSQEKGVMLNNLTNETTNAGKALHRALEYLSEVTVCLAIYAMMLLASWKITLLLTAGAVIVLILFWGVSQRYSLSVGRETILLNQALMARAQEALNALREVKAYGLEREILRIFNQRTDELLKMVLRFRTFLEVPVPTSEFFVVVLLVAGLLYAEYGSGSSAVAMIPLLSFFAVSSQKLYGRLSRVFAGSMSLFSFLPSLELVHGIMSLAVESFVPRGRSRKVIIKQLDGDIIFDRVSFSYPDSREALFRNLSLRIPKGQIVGVMGRSGSGKSTLADLLCGLYPSYEGEIQVGRFDLREVDPNSWHRIIGLVTQEPFLFSTTIGENILMGRPGASFEDVISAARKAQAHEFIARLAKGYDTSVADQGFLSVGQKQRIAIARAILRDPEIYIFDEATSALDPEAETYIQAFIESLNGRKTVLVITHRHSNIVKADIVYVLDGGRIVESGMYGNLKTVAGLGGV